MTEAPANDNKGGLPTDPAARKKRLWMIAFVSLLGGIALGGGCSMALKWLLM